MARGSREDVQDRILNQMDKTNRKHAGERNGNALTLKEQLEEEAAYNKLSPEEKLKRMSFYDWVRLVKKTADEKRVPLTERWMSTVSANNNKDYQIAFRKFHENGTALTEVISWLRDEGYKVW